MAWVEGWAEFYAAVCYNHYYSIELPIHPEYNALGPLYHYLDYTVGVLDASFGPEIDREESEGMVACFLYSLWDGTGIRSLDYEGDNDDVHISGEDIISALSNRYDDVTWLCNYDLGAYDTHIEAFAQELMNLSSGTGDTDESVEKLWDYIFENSGVPYSAAPTNLTIDSRSRTLTWDDHTCPSQYPWAPTVNIDIFENNEATYRIYREAGDTPPLPRSLAGFTLIASTGEDVTTFVDYDNHLSGYYNYIVVANNSSGVTPPMDYANVYYVATPLGFHISASGQYPFLDWDENPAMNVRYDVWRKRAGVYTQIGFAISTSYFLDTSVTINNPLTPSDVVYYKVIAKKYMVNNWVYSPDSEEIQVTINGNKIAKPIISSVPTEITIGNNYPNPFNGFTKFDFFIPTEMHVSVNIYDVNGRVVKSLLDTVIRSGWQELTWNCKDELGNDVQTGLYLLKFETSNFREVKKIMLVK